MAPALEGRPAGALEVAPKWKKIVRVGGGPWNFLLLPGPSFVFFGFYMPEYSK